MLLNQLKVGGCTGLRSSAASRDGFVVRRASSESVQKRSPVQVRASSSAEGAGWLESASSKLGKAAGFAEKKVQGAGGKDGAGGGVVVYKGTAVLMKKLKILDLMDRVADAQDDASELLQGKKVSVQLVSNEIDPSTGKGMMSSEVNIEGWVTIFDPLTAENISFDLEFAVPKTFGVPGAIVVKNNHPNEFLLVSFTLALPDKSNAEYMANSWVYNTEKAGPRIFFHNKAYLPAETPEALKELREKELDALRGDGTGERKEGERIYDYDCYNDLGKPDDGPTSARPPLGGNAEFPFPRRVRTGRPKTKTSSVTEMRAASPYIPTDERFDHVKLSDNKADMVRAAGHAISSKIQAKLSKKTSFESIEEVKKLYAPKGKFAGGINNVLPAKADVSTHDQQPLVFLKELTAKRNDGEKNNILLFPIPQIIQADEKAWQTNAEFAREYLAGFNSIQIQCVKEFPIKSALSAAEFGDPTSAISENHIDGQLEGLSVQEAVAQKKLFVVDYHDTFLPWVERINALENSKTYASRTLFFLSSDETMKVLAIELVLPPKTPGGDKIARVFMPSADDSTNDIVFQLAKAHATNNEMTVHQAISHFTRCHAVTEPAIIAHHRQLSIMHPIHQLMAPHFKHTIEVNSTARLNLLPAGGTIEEIYTPRIYVVRMAAAWYRDYWTFDSIALPNDLIQRGMAVPDPSAKHGVKLVVNDYPYAADGLEVWSAMKGWNAEYIDIYYKDDSAVQQDPELQKWYTEYRTVGHGDKKDAPGWPELNSKENMVEIITTVQWIATAMHAPINFGQYDYAGFMPYRPAITRRLIPDEGTKEWEEMNANPEKFFMSTVSDTDTTTTAMAVFEVVAAHAPNEEYIDERAPGWTENEQAKAAFKRYSDKLQDVDQLIQSRNADPNLKNRCGPAKMPFQLLRPHSGPGVTGRGIPNSITV